MKCDRCEKEFAKDEIFIQKIDEKTNVLESICLDCVSPDKSEGEYGMGGDWWKGDNNE